MALVSIPFPGTCLEYGIRGQPAVILVHDWYGRLPYLEEFSILLTSRGFHVLVPDFYDGWAATDVGDAAELLSRLDLIATANAIGTLVHETRSGGAARVGLVGFSMGGWLAITQAQAGSVNAVVAYDAPLSRIYDGVLPCPVQLHLADDNISEMRDPDSFIARLTDDGTTLECHHYSRSVSYSATHPSDLIAGEPMALAFLRTAEFLEKHLSG